MEIRVYRAECGDAARITFRNEAGMMRHVFIDAGFERTYRDLLHREIEEIKNRGEEIALWIISHIHSDHIGGVVNYTGAIRNGFQADVVKQWLYNPPRSEKKSAAAQGFSFAASIAQGNALSRYLHTAGKDPISSFTYLTPPIEIDELKITILSPGPAQLEKLRKKYKQPNVPLERIEDDRISDAKGAKSSDHYIKGIDFDLTKTIEDDNIENGSSIAVLMGLKDKKVLWLADAHPSVIVKGLKQLGYGPKTPISCNYVKVSHHGSAGNSSDELYRLIDCAHFIFSVNGDNKDRLPNKRALMTILKHTGRDLTRKYHFYLPYDDPVLRSIFKVDTDQIFRELNFEMHFSTGKYLLFNL